MAIVTDTYSAKANLSRLLDEVEAGGEVVITRRGKPVARLVAPGPSASGIRFGALKGQIGPVPDDDPDWQAIIAAMHGDAPA